MFELIAIIGGLVLCFYLPYETGKVRGGWVRKRFKGPPESFRAAYIKQLTYFMWFGVAIGAVDVVLAPLSLRRGEWVFKLISAAIWLAVAAVAYHSRGRLAEQPA